MRSSTFTITTAAFLAPAILAQVSEDTTTETPTTPFLTATESIPEVSITESATSTGISLTESFIESSFSDVVSSEAPFPASNTTDAVGSGTGSTSVVTKSNTDTVLESSTQTVDGPEATGGDDDGGDFNDGNDDSAGMRTSAGIGAVGLMIGGMFFAML